MGNDACSWDDFSIYAAPDKLSSSDKELESCNVGNQGKPSGFYGVEESGEMVAVDSFPCYGFYGDESMVATGFGLSKQDPQQQQQQQQNFKDCGLLDGVSFNAQSPLIPTCFNEIAELGQINYGICEDIDEAKKGKQQPLCLSSLGLLNNYGNGFKRFHGERRAHDDITVSDARDDGDRKFSTEEIMRIAGEMFVKSCGQTVGGISMIQYPFNVPFSGLLDRETRDAELAVLLLAAAEKIGYQQYESASRLLKQCDYMSSKTGNPIQRVVYYFSEALREKIERSSSKGLKWKPLFNIDEAMMTMNPIVLACHQEFPFAKVTQFAGIQAIVENVAEAKKVHIIDLAVRHGVHWTILMQALASRQHECRLELLKITAVSTEAKALVECTGERLSSFAQSLGVPFAFKAVMVSDMLDLREDHFEIDAEESIVAYAAFAFRRMLVKPNRIENIMRVLRVMNPCLMVVTEVEGNHNSPIFVNRFVEVLFFFSAYFDCTATCMKQDSKNREILESVFFGEGIRNMIATEGDERKVRHVKFDVWRAFFVRYGMEEAELSMSSMYQVDLILNTFVDGTSCTLDMNGKTLLIGWKGSPMHSISVWKFL
ncbi:seed maturation protein PM36-like [Hibiscus syriacus]|uniref:Seed maturation protein PM36-like n=1 Tax=Hibiscus syriacus TaxID=106335 RepID=A0A6A3D0P1_HIBSY|nr:DELLA protein RGL1-like [Hibiscus syriacus]KAE8734184.1 seed maturation protein PM36-like [Hibiscus syriacus]